jgi:FKBP-type peptidyl-prolyl cis-trans isomerase FkpA
MKKLIPFVAIALMASCSNVKETPRGFQFTVLRAGDGILAKPGQYLVMSMVFKDAKDSVWNDTRKNEVPWVIQIQDTAARRMENGMDEIYRLLSKGDSITFKVNTRILFERTFRQPIPGTLDPKSDFVFHIGVNDIMTREQVMELEEKIVAQQNVKYMEKQKEQVKKDGEIIDEFLKKAKIEAQVDSSGLRYVISKQGSGKKPTLSDTVVVTYVGKLLEDGKVFDQSVKPITFALGRLIPGWQVGFPLLPVGSKATLYIPSSLGYGANGSPPNIPADANLIFEVELIGIKK